MIRTTITLDEDTFKEAKKYAIDQRNAFGDVVNQALRDYLQGRKRLTPRKFNLKIYKMGKAKGSLNRTEIYANL